MNRSINKENSEGTVYKFKDFNVEQAESSHVNELKIFEE